MTHSTHSSHSSLPTTQHNLPYYPSLQQQDTTQLPPLQHNNNQYTQPVSSAVVLNQFYFNEHQNQNDQQLITQQSQHSITSSHNTTATHTNSLYQNNHLTTKQKHQEHIARVYTELPFGILPTTTPTLQERTWGNETESKRKIHTESRC